MQQIKESDVKAMLESMAENLPDLEREALKDLLLAYANARLLRLTGHSGSRYALACPCDDKTESSY